MNRGIATGKNEYFCLREDELAGSAAGHEWEIDERYLSKLVRNSRSVPHFDYCEDDWESARAEGEEVWLLYHLGGPERWLGSSRGQSGSERNARPDEFAEDRGKDEDDEGENGTGDREGNVTDGGDGERQPGVAEYLGRGGRSTTATWPATGSRGTWWIGAIRPRSAIRT